MVVIRNTQESENLRHVKLRFILQKVKKDMFLRKHSLRKKVKTSYYTNGRYLLQNPVVAVMKCPI